MNILKKLRKAAFKQTVILLILGVILMGLGVMFTVMPDEPPTDLSTLSFTELQDDSFVSLSKFAIFYEYAWIEDGDETDWFCIIGAVDKNDDAYLITLKVTDSEAQRLMDRLDPEAEELIWFEDEEYYGTLTALPDDAKAFYDEELATFSLGPSDKVSYLYLEATPGIYEVDNTGNIIGGTVFIVMGLLMMILPLMVLFGFTQGKARKAAAQLSGSGNARFYLEDFDTNAVEVNGVYFTHDAVLFNQGYVARLLPLKDLVWAYRKEVDQRLYFFIRIATYHFIMMKTADKKHSQIMFRKQDQMEAVMTALKERCPELVVTKYDRQLEKLFKQDPSSFKAAVSEISQRLKAQAEASKE